MTKTPIRINRDVSGDVLYISFGEPRPSYSEEIGDGVYARYDMLTDELTGITILDFSKRSKDDIVQTILSETVVKSEVVESIEVLH